MFLPLTTTFADLMPEESTVVIPFSMNKWEIAWVVQGCRQQRSPQCHKKKHVGLVACNP